MSAHWLQTKHEVLVEVGVVPETEMIPETEVAPEIDTVPEADKVPGLKGELEGKAVLDCKSEPGTVILPVAESEWETEVGYEGQDGFDSETVVVGEFETEHGTGLAYSAVVDYELGIVSQVGIETGLEIESEEMGGVFQVGAAHKIQSGSDIASGPDVKCVPLAEYSTSVSQPVLESEPDSGADTLDYGWATGSYSLPLLATCFD